MRTGAVAPPTASRWRFDADAELLLGLSRGAEGDGRVFVDPARRGGACEGLGCISPLAVVILFVNDEIAQPAQPVSF